MSYRTTTTMRVTPEHVRYWLRQFRDDEEVECAFRLIEAIRIIGRSDVHGAMKKMCKAFDVKGAYLSSVASPRDSGGITSYYAGDMISEFSLEPVNLSDALVRADSKPLVFIEDFVGSGGQLCSTFLNWFGKGDDPRVLDEYHGDPLTEEAQEAMRRRQLYFGFVAGQREGAAAVEKIGKELNLKLHVYLDMTQEVLPTAFSGTWVKYPSEGAKQRFQARCSNIGEQLLKTSPAGPRKKETIPDRVLGYGNQAFLVAFPYNVPTQALTLLWSSGTVDGYPWMPLLPRRKK